MSEVLVSFVVPAYNEEALIASCLNAIQAEISRSGCNAEIIVVNNNSTDDTRRIASSYRASSSSMSGKGGWCRPARPGVSPPAAN